MSEQAQSDSKLTTTKRLITRWRKPAKALGALVVAALLLLTGMGLGQRVGAPRFADYELAGAPSSSPAPSQVAPSADAFRFRTAEYQSEAGRQGRQGTERSGLHSQPADAGAQGWAGGGGEGFA